MVSGGSRREAIWISSIPTTEISDGTRRPCLLSVEIIPIATRSFAATAGDPVGMVLETFDRQQNPVPCRIGNARLPIDDRRDGLDRDIGHPGNVCNGRLTERAHLGDERSYERCYSRLTSASIGKLSVALHTNDSFTWEPTSGRVKALLPRFSSFRHRRLFPPQRWGNSPLLTPATRNPSASRIARILPG